MFKYLIASLFAFLFNTNIILLALYLDKCAIKEFLSKLNRWKKDSPNKKIGFDLIKIALEKVLFF
jgi:hypothetical protein